MASPPQMPAWTTELVTDEMLELMIRDAWRQTCDQLDVALAADAAGPGPEQATNGQ